MQVEGHVGGMIFTAHRGGGGAMEVIICSQLALVWLTDLSMYHVHKKVMYMWSHMYGIFWAEGKKLFQKIVYYIFLKT